MRFNTGEMAGLANVGEMVELIAKRTDEKTIIMKARRLAWIALVVVVLSGLMGSILGTEKAVKPAACQLRRAWLLLTGHLIDVGGYRLRIERQVTGPRR